MKITTEMVDYISELSRLKLPEEEKEKMTGELEQILAYMDTLNALDTSGVEPMTHIFPVNNVFREDEEKDEWSREEILENAPKQKDGFFQVPKTVE